MANTFILIQNTSLTGNSTSITFNSIPGTYNDLLLKISARGDIASTAQNLFIKFNNITSGYGMNYYYFINNSTGASNNPNQSNMNINCPAANSTASIFGGAEIYIPNYIGSPAINKSFSSQWIRENNSTTAGTEVSAGAFSLSNTAAITSITITTDGTNNFVSGSSFCLYGIKNA